MFTGNQTPSSLYAVQLVDPLKCKFTNGRRTNSKVTSWKKGIKKSAPPYYPSP